MSDTIQKIKTALFHLGIIIQEIWNKTGVLNCYSVRITSRQIPIGGKGTGVSKDAALEVAYQQLIARIQTGYCYTGRQDDTLSGFENFFFSPEEKYRFSAELLEMKQEWFQKFYEEIMQKSRQYYNQNGFLQLLSYEHYTVTDKDFITLPFRNQRTGAIEEIPTVVLKDYYGTEGICAGNSKKEAFIHGLSNLIQKNHMIQIHEKCITPPDIPDKFLMRYQNVWDIITDIRRRESYSLMIKDCSLGTGFPVTAAVLINRDCAEYLIAFGADPCLETALEECLTKLFEDRPIERAACVENVICDSRKLNKVDTLHNILENFVGEYHYSFFYGDLSYEFSLSDDCARGEEEKAYEKAIQYFSGKGYDIYIRNCSYFKYDSFQIVIPCYSELYRTGLLPLKEMTRYAQCMQIMDHLADATEEEIKKLKTFLQFKENFIFENRLGYLTGLPIVNMNEELHYCYIALIVSIYLKDYKNAENLLNIIMRNSISKEEYLYFSCLKKVLEFMEYEKDEEQLYRYLRNFFQAEVIEEVLNDLKERPLLIEKLGFSCKQFACDQCIHRKKCNYQEVRAVYKNIKMEMRKNPTMKTDVEPMKGKKEFNLSRREKEIAKYYVEGHSRREIADALIISENTVKKHLNNIYKKTGSKNRSEIYEIVREHYR